MFWHRVDYYLEFAAIMDMMMFPDISSCTEATQDAGWQLQSNYDTGVWYGMDLMNMGSFLKNVADFLEENYG